VPAVVQRDEFIAATFQRDFVNMFGCLSDDAAERTLTQILAAQPVRQKE